MSERLSMRKAAVAIHRARSYVRRLIDEGKVRAFKIGGTDKNPWLAVDIDELRAAVDKDSLWVPPGLKVSKRPARKVNDDELHPLIAAWK